MWFLMLSSQRTLKLSALVLSMVLLTACMGTTSVPSPVIVTSVAPSPTMSQPTPTSTPTLSLPTLSIPNDLQMAYAIDGNLFFQEGGDLPQQLTSGGEDWRPLFFSDSEEKIYFFRGLIPHSLYSINTDGSQEQVLVTTSLLVALDTRYDESTTPCNPVIVPHTNLLLFSTCSHPDLQTTIRNDDLLILDTDSLHINILLPPGQASAYDVSPDGKMVAVVTLDQIDILDINGKVIHPNLITYIPSEPIPLSPIIYWAQDSTQLVVLLPVDTTYDTSTPPTYTIWRYALDTNSRVQISLDPPPMGYDPASVAPDGNWIVYNNYDQRSFYVGDLQAARTQLYEAQSDVYGYAWSPDSMHFSYGVYQPGGRGLYLGSINVSSIFIDQGDFVGWLDANRYLYFANQAIIMGEIGGKSIPILVGEAQSPFLDSPNRFIFTLRDH